jgi:hypothetical protein
MTMNKDNLEQNIQKNVLEKIRRGRVHIRPKAYFIARLGFTIFITLLALIISAFVVSFVAFTVHESGEQFLLGFGWQGVLTFFLLFPWVSLLLDIAILFFLEWLLQGFKLGYRISLLTIFIGIFACSSVFGIVISFTPLHQVLLDKADKGTLPIIGEIYESVRDSHTGQGVFKGTITSMQGNKIVIFHDDKDHDEDDGTRTVVLPQSYPPLHVGDRVYVFGSFSNGEITARGVNMLSPNQ